MRARPLELKSTRPSATWIGGRLALALVLAHTCAFSSAQETAVSPRRSTHEAQLEELGAAIHARSDDHAEALRLARALDTVTTAPQRAQQGTAWNNRSGPGVDPDFIVFGYLQSETQVFHQRWHALTHVGSRFVNFDAQGNLTNLGAFTQRSSYLRAGGAAEAAGVKVILVLANFDDAAGGSLERVMTSGARRTNLVNQLVAALAADSYSHGISLDLEFSWGPAVRDG
ncbi:MAG: hypothetical protein AAGG01_16830, partial [Planctomycetota bacterium]